MSLVRDMRSNFGTTVLALAQSGRILRQLVVVVGRIRTFAICSLTTLNRPSGAIVGVLTPEPIDLFHIFHGVDILIDHLFPEHVIPVPTVNGSNVCDRVTVLIEQTTGSGPLKILAEPALPVGSQRPGAAVRPPLLGLTVQHLVGVLLLVPAPLSLRKLRRETAMTTSNLPGLERSRTHGAKSSPLA